MHALHHNEALVAWGGNLATQRYKRQDCSAPQCWAAVFAAMETPNVRRVGAAMKAMTELLQDKSFSTTSFRSLIESSSNEAFRRLGYLLETSEDYFRGSCSGRAVNRLSKVKKLLNDEYRNRFGLAVGNETLVNYMNHLRPSDLRRSLNCTQNKWLVSAPKNVWLEYVE